MSGVFANRSAKSDFIINEIEACAVDNVNIYIASAFFTEAEIVERMLAKGCTINLIVRLGFPTDPRALERVMKHPRMQLRFYTGHSFHPKLYIFGDETALVGSANLTRSALLTNQEVMVTIGSDDTRFYELISIFEDYWESAEVLTDKQLEVYRAIYKEHLKHAAATDSLSDEVLRLLGDTSPPNIKRDIPKANKQALFTSSYRRTYQEATAAFEIVRQAYAGSGYRKIAESEIPLRLEIDSFISFVREEYANVDHWKEGPLRTPIEQRPFIENLIGQWKDVNWPHFETKIVKINYPRLKQIFHSRESILNSNDSDLFDGLSTLHSFHDRFRFFDGGLQTWKNEFPKFNDAKRTREIIVYLIYGNGDVIERMANVIYHPDYKLNEFGQANVQELVGWTNKENLPIINSRTTKVLRYFGSKVRQL